MKLPERVQLPSKRIVLLALDEKEGKMPGRTLFASAKRLVSRMHIDALVLADFHALRAIATRVGLLEEEEITASCLNCGAEMRVRPCAELQLGPFTDVELDDEDLDALFDFEQGHDVEGLGMVHLEQRTLAQAEPLHRALARKRFVISEAVVRAMGVVRIDEETDPSVLAKQLTECSDDAFDALSDLFLQAHYPDRLFSFAKCPKCGARNDFDAPYDRELAPSRAPMEMEAFIDFDAFDRKVHTIAKTIEFPSDVILIVEGGVPDCDDGGVPLLGSYVPKDDGTIVRPAEVTVYYRTFRSMWEEGSYDVDGEIAETLEHELEHHELGLTGHDPKDEEEREEIAHEARRTVGRKELQRAAFRWLGSDIWSFFRRTYLIWLLALIATLIAVWTARQ